MLFQPSVVRTPPDDAGAAPKVRTERLGFGRIRAGFVLASFTHGSDPAKGMSHDGQSLTPSRRRDGQAEPPVQSHTERGANAAHRIESRGALGAQGFVQGCDIFRRSEVWLKRNQPGVYHERWRCPAGEAGGLFLMF